MNHTERIAETTRRHRHLSRRMAKEVTETYLELLVEEIAQGQWVNVHEIGKIQVSIEEGSGKEGLKNYLRLCTKLALARASRADITQHPERKVKIRA